VISREAFPPFSGPSCSRSIFSLSKINQNTFDLRLTLRYVERSL